MLLLTVTSRLPACRSYIEKHPDLDVGPSSAVADARGR
jgi:hypothetical protein